MVAAGTTSKLTGGKFVNGAGYAAFNALVSSLAPPRQPGSSTSSQQQASGAQGSTSGAAQSTPGNKSIFRGALDVAGKLWALPNTIIGLVYGGIGHVIGELGNVFGYFGHEPSISFGNNAIQFKNNPLMGTAMAIGNTVIYANERPYHPGAIVYGGHTLGIEEMQHTYQSQVLGPLYLPAHAIFGTAAKLVNGYWHGAINFLETGPHDGSPRYCMTMASKRGEATPYSI